jgi:hypothetical protein
MWLHRDGGGGHFMGSCDAIWTGNACDMFTSDATIGPTLQFPPLAWATWCSNIHSACVIVRAQRAEPFFAMPRCAVPCCAVL